MNQAAERVESLKAGVVGAIVGVTVFFAISSFTWLIPDKSFERGIPLVSFPILVESGIAVLSGFLFSVTYRYIVRTDRSFQLKTGAVLAFGLVRGLAQIGVTFTNEPYWQAGIRLLESLLIFAAIALLLEGLMQRGWLKRFDAK
jgi:uncharacterized membrane protein YoaT (DUF817 family)